LLKILAHFGVSAGEGIFIGDSPVDAEHAGAVGMPLVAFRSPGLAAAHHVASFKEVLRLPPFAGSDVRAAALTRPSSASPTAKKTAIDRIAGRWLRSRRDRPEDQRPKDRRGLADEE